MDISSSLKHLQQKYIYGVTFEEIVSFYYFDEQLRSLFFKYILHIEKQMKSMVSYYFCDKYGESQTAYLDIKNYTVTRRNNNDVQRLIKKLITSVLKSCPHITKAQLLSLMGFPENWNQITRYRKI